MKEQENVSKTKMLQVLESWKLKTPNAEIKSMPEGLRKEVREYVRYYLGDYSRQINTIKQLKKEEYFKKYRELIKKDLNTSEISLQIKRFNKLARDLSDEYKRLKEYDKEDSKLSFNHSYYEEFKVVLSEGYVDNILNKEFDKLYASGFIEFSNLLKKFEQKIEEAILFGTITDVYGIICKYSQFDPYLKKLSNLKIK